MKKFGFFISYASEDKLLAFEIAKHLKSFGINSWFDETEVKIGDSIIEKINAGLNQTKCGILIFSPNFIKKNWTKYEHDVLLRQHIEQGKQIFPIWHKIKKEEVEEFSPAMANIKAGKSEDPLENIMNEVISRAYADVSTFLTIPSYEGALFRFSQGRGELYVNKSAFNLWGALLYFKDEDYPLGLEGKLIQKFDLIMWARELIDCEGDDFLKQQVHDEEKAKKIKQICLYE